MPDKMPIEVAPTQEVTALVYTASEPDLAGVDGQREISQRCDCRVAGAVDLGDRLEVDQLVRTHR